MSDLRNGSRAGNEKERFTIGIRAVEWRWYARDGRNAGNAKRQADKRRAVSRIRRPR